MKLTAPAAQAISQPAPNLKRQISSGLLWTGLGRVAQQVAQFGLTVILARLLSPEDFGILAMAAVFTGFATTLSDAGFSTALIQKQNIREDHINTVFWVNVASNIFLTALMFLLAPWLAAFYKTPILMPIFRVVGLNFLIGSLGSVHGALLQKEMQFKSIAGISTASVTLSGTLGVILAWMGAGVWSLVVQGIAASLVLTLLRWRFSKWRPRLSFSLEALRELFGFASHLYAFNLINYWSRNGDNLLIGKYFGASVLGAYSRAYMLMLLPITQISSVAAGVVFPAFSTLQKEKERVRRIYLRAVGVLALVTFPAMVGLAVVAKPFVMTVYGSKWAEVAPLLQILAVVGLMQVIGNSLGWLFSSQGRTDVLLAWGAAYSVMVIAGFIIGTIMGSVVAVAISYVIVNAIVFYPELNAAARLVGSSGEEVMRAVCGPLLCSFIMGLAVAAIHITLPATRPAWQILLALTASGISIYLALIKFGKLAAFHDLLNLIAEKRQARKAAVAS